MLTNRPFDRDTMTNIGSNREPKKSGIMSSLASAIERGKQTRLRNEARRFGKAGKPKPPKRVSDPIVSEFQLAIMIDAGYEPARRDLSGNIVNPYGSTGLKQYISFPNLEQNQRNEILNKRVQRFMNPQTDDPSLRRGFGSLFGSSEGEPTISGPLRKQIEPMSPIEMGARGIFSLLPGNIFGPIVSMADPAGTTMVPEFSADYDPDKDPRNNPQSMVGSMLDFFTGGAGTEALSRISDLLPGRQTTPTMGMDFGIGFEDVPDNVLVPEPTLTDIQNLGSQFGDTRVVTDDNVLTGVQSVSDLLTAEREGSSFRPDMRRPFEYTLENQLARSMPTEPELF